MGKVKGLAIDIMEENERAAKSEYQPEVWYCKQCERQFVWNVIPPKECPYECGGDDFWHETDGEAPFNQHGEEESLSFIDQHR